MFNIYIHSILGWGLSKPAHQAETIYSTFESVFPSLHNFLTNNLNAKMEVCLSQNFIDNRPVIC